MKLPPAGRRWILTLAALALWVFVSWRALGVFTPGNEDNEVSFNSDSAIGVLMANDDRPITVFNAYYYCADRWGGWPFLMAQVIRRATGYAWTPHSVFAMQALWVLLGAWACAGLCRRDWAIAGLAYLIATCVYPGARFLVFELSQIYGWQLTGLLFGWMGLRRVFDSVMRSRTAAGTRSAVSAVNGAAAGWFLFALVFTFLAVWTSVASLPILLVLCAIEVARARAKGVVQAAEIPPADVESTHVESTDVGPARASASWRQLAIGSALGLAAVAGGALLERLLKARYHRWSLEHYGAEFSTTFHIDHGYLLHSVGIQMMHLVRQPWWPLYALPIVALIATAAVFVYALVARKHQPRLALTRLAADDTAMTVLGAVAIATSAFTLAVLVDHVRLNDYDSRYLTLTNVFMPMAGMLTLALAIRMIARTALQRALVQPAFAAVAILLLVAAFPIPRAWEPYRVQQETARVLIERAPRGVLLGDYWDVYLLASLQPPERAMTPVTWPGYSRTPWTPAAIKTAREVIVVYPKSGVARGPSVTMPPVLEQHGATLRLADQHWFENDAYQFGRYINATAVNTAR